MKQKKIPVRTCIVCKQARPKKELIRIVKNKEEEVFVDATGKKNGRGAYLCPTFECLDRAYSTKLLKKTMDIDFTEEMYTEAKRVILRREIDQ